MEAERFLLKWNNHQSNLVTVFDQLYEQEAFTDVTLACDGRSFAAHKVILSACSPYFQQLFISNPCNHPIIFMRDVQASDLDALLAFMYRGEINVHQRDLSSFLKTAESLQIKGLSDSSDKPRESSKILEAVERKFSNSNNIGLPYGNFINSSMNKNAINAMLPALTGLGKALSQQNNNNNNRFQPPPKKMKTSQEDFPKILPKVKNFGSNILPGLVSPITLAKTVMTGSTTPQLSPEGNNGRISPDDSSPEKEKKTGESDEENDEKSFVEGFIPGDTPHSVYLVSSVGGLQGMNSSGNSTPCNDIKIEEEEIDENHLDDNATNSQMDADTMAQNTRENNSSEGLNQNANMPTKPDLSLSIDSTTPNETTSLVCTSISKQNFFNLDPLKRHENQLIRSVMNRLEASGDDIQNNPEFLACLEREVKAKSMQGKLHKESIEISSLSDHTYIVPKPGSKQNPTKYSCGKCSKTFPRSRRQRYLRHLETHKK